MEAREPFASYLLKVDVSQFYPSLYTHAVGWAIDPKLRERNQWNNRALLGKRIDQCLMNLQGKVSQGIPIGTDIPFLLAEIVLGQVDKVSGLPAQQSYRWHDDYEVACSNRQEAEATLARLTQALDAFKLRLNPLKTAIYELPRASGEGWQSDLLALGRRSISSASALATYFDEAFRLRQAHPEHPVLMYAIDILFQLRNPSRQVHRVAESCISQSLLAEPGCAQKAFALLTYWELNRVQFDRALAARTIDKLFALHESRGISSEIAWALAFTIQHAMVLGREVGLRLRKLEDDAVAIQALHASALGLLPGFDDHRIKRALKVESCDGEHWMVLYASVRQGFLPSVSPIVQRNPLMGQMLSAGVTFYRRHLPTYAMLVHPGGAPQWVVDAWIRRVAERRQKRVRLLPVEKLLETDLVSSDSARQATRDFLRLLRGRVEGQKLRRPERYE